jgi:hypothetical protein
MKETLPSFIKALCPLPSALCFLKGLQVTILDPNRGVIHTGSYWRNLALLIVTRGETPNE